MAYLNETRLAHVEVGERLGLGFAALARRYSNWRLYRRTVKELEALSAHELDDLGLTPSDIQRVAREGVYGL